MRPIALASGLLMVLLVPAHSLAIELQADGSWIPAVAFELEDATEQEALIWVSGWSYALTAVAKAEAESGAPHLFCPTAGHVESRVMLTILNDRFPGRRITTDQAMAALWRGLRDYYPCNMNEDGSGD